MRAGATTLRRVAIAHVPGKGRALVAQRPLRPGQQVMREAAVCTCPAVPSSTVDVPSTAFEALARRFPRLAADCVDRGGLCLPLMAAQLLDSGGGGGGDSGASARAVREALEQLCHVRMDSDTVPSEWRTWFTLFNDDVGRRGVADKRSEEDKFLRTLGTLHLNVHEAGGKRLLFHVGSFLNHDCSPNAELRVPHPDSHPVLGVWHAVREIPIGGEITCSYLDTGLDFVSRQEILWTYYGFECRCARCQREKGAAANPTPR